MRERAPSMHTTRTTQRLKLKNKKATMAESNRLARKINGPLACEKGGLAGSEQAHLVTMSSIAPSESSNHDI